MKTKFGLLQFWQQNEPKLAATIGNIALMLATLNGLILGLPAMMVASGITDFTMPIQVTHIARILLILSVICKAVTKMFGVVDGENNPVNPLPPATKSQQ